MNWRKSPQASNFTTFSLSICRFYFFHEFWIIKLNKIFFYPSANRKWQSIISDNPLVLKLPPNSINRYIFIFINHTTKQTPKPNRKNKVPISTVDPLKRSWPLIWSRYFQNSAPKTKTKTLFFLRSLSRVVRFSFENQDSRSAPRESTKVPRHWYASGRGNFGRQKDAIFCQFMPPLQMLVPVENYRRK